jgi:hypothetical protein
MPEEGALHPIKDFARLTVIQEFNGLAGAEVTGAKPMAAGIF